MERTQDQGDTPDSSAHAPSLAPERRSWAAHKEGGLRTVDGATRARLFRVAAWAVIPSVFLGAALSMAVGILMGMVLAILIFVLTTGIALGITEGAGGAASTFLHPAAGSRGVTNSRAEALLTQARAEEAATAWEVTALEHPDDPTAPAAIARIHRDYLSDPEQSVSWFRRALRVAGASPTARILIRELVEVSRRLPDGGASAAPELARYASGNEGNTEGEWAAAELRTIKKMIAEAEGRTGEG